MVQKQDSTSNLAADIDAEIGRRILFERAFQSITQPQLAAAIGVTVRQLRKYENGTNRISAGRLLQIARFLGVPAAGLYRGLDLSNCDFDQPWSANMRWVRLLTRDPCSERLFRAYARLRNKEERLRILETIEGHARR